MLNGSAIEVVDEPVLQGRYSVKIVITEDDLWPNGLNRVELQHQSKHTKPGDLTYVGWSVYLPKTLIATDHLIGYWETQTSYQQLISVIANGEQLALATNLSSPRVQWSADGILTTGKWHRIVMSVHWSKDPGHGQVSLWFDSQAVVDKPNVQTFLDHPAFLQLGLLRQPTLTIVEELVVDCALEGARFEDVAYFRAGIERRD